MNHRYFSLALFLLLVVITAVIGSGFDAGEWYYVTMERPSMAPPGWLYAVAWALVYVLMALAAWKVWLTEHFSRLGVLTWWVLLLVLNYGWAVLFFGWHRPGWALPMLGITIVVAIFCIRAFRPISRDAAWLMAPYLIWTVFLWALNLVIWTINGGFPGRFVA